MTSRITRLTLDGAEDPVLFYAPRDPYGCFSNFSDHVVTMLSPWTEEPTWYRTGEVRFQAMKATHQDPHDRLVARSNAAGTPSECSYEAKTLGRRIELRGDWGQDINTACWFVMVEVLIAKTLQHPDVMRTLMSTGERHIYEDSPTDDIWGWRYRGDHRGKNLLGRGWMHVRYLFNSMSDG